MGWETASVPVNHIRNVPSSNQFKYLSYTNSIRWPFHGFVFLDSAGEAAVYILLWNY